MATTAEVQRILSLARRADASDIHIVAGLPPLFRINGEIILADSPPLAREDTKRLCYSLLNEEQQKVFERDWQICCSVFDDRFGRFRVSIYYRAGNPEMALRPVTDQIKSRQELHLPVQIEDLTRLASGLVLVTGPTGSGKTTTMNFMIDVINSERRCKIITIEDPVEFVHAQKRAVIVQQELYTDVKTFAAALVHVLRQDPDVICVGEMRDLDTTATALMAAETGHLVIATCHTPNTFQTIERIVSIFPDTQQPQVVTQLANSLKGVVAQRLVPSADKKRRVLATELLLVNAPARRHIREGEFHQLVNVIQVGRRQGMHLMDDCLFDLYQAGEITYEAALTNANDPNQMKQRIHEDSPSMRRENDVW
ncbi:MAG TPA: PilT/PilU family type 4a pilus ATPase [Anaerohalosphaeraceae bacterium]|nr:PilT/PilU family type 4a pilus ATPase [Anaerohalosphaeraceae bacterium]HRT50479.1 PilT/PilU family type 4a pilus ATPase [Anaerohalosphaeraceae bacterium]HRT86409.1 PilT/PilU family type 4a pilus ATPase [Anaerohalosphaeraceae bacterium]